MLVMRMVMMRLTRLHKKRLVRICTRVCRVCGAIEYMNVVMTVPNCPVKLWMGCIGPCLRNARV